MSHFSYIQNTCILKYEKNNTFKGLIVSFLKVLVYLYLNNIYIIALF